MECNFKYFSMAGSACAASLANVLAIPLVLGNTMFPLQVQARTPSNPARSERAVRAFVDSIRVLPILIPVNSTINTVTSLAATGSA
jgi:hypothetical protein